MTMNPDLREPRGIDADWIPGAEIGNDKMVPGVMQRMSRRAFMKVAGAAGSAVAMLAACEVSQQPLPTRLPVVTPSTPDRPTPTPLPALRPIVFPTELPTPLPGGPDDILVNAGISPWPTSLEEVPEQFAGGGEYILDVYAPNVQRQYGDVRRLLTTASFSIVDERSKLTNPNDVYLVVVENPDPYRWAVAGVTRTGFVVPIDKNDAVMDRPDWATNDVDHYEEVPDGYGAEYLRNWELVNDHWVPVVRDAHGKLLAFYDLNKGEFVRSEVTADDIVEMLHGMTNEGLTNSTEINIGAINIPYEVIITEGGLFKKFQTSPTTMENMFLYVFARLGLFVRDAGVSSDPFPEYGEKPMSSFLGDNTDPNDLIDAGRKRLEDGRPFTTDVFSLLKKHIYGFSYGPSPEDSRLPVGEPITKLTTVIATRDIFNRVKSQLDKANISYFYVHQLPAEFDNPTVGHVVKDADDIEYLLFYKDGHMIIINHQDIDGLIPLWRNSIVKAQTDFTEAQRIGSLWGFTYFVQPFDYKPGISYGWNVVYPLIDEAEIEANQ